MMIFDEKEEKHEKVGKSKDGQKGKCQSDTKRYKHNDLWANAKPHCSIINLY